MNFFSDDAIPETAVDTDVVEVDILIDAPIDVVWNLVSEPGWWINDGPMGDHEVVVNEDGIYQVADPEAGAWLVEKTDEDPMDLVAFRWYPIAGDELPDEGTTRVEVSLSEEDGQTALHIEESGFSQLSDDEELCLSTWDEAQGMWHEVLTQAKAHLES